MKILWLIVAGLSSGVVAGMGMGGGTLLIPILTIFLGIEQHQAQGMNLFAFIPTAVVSLVIHIKNKLVDFKVAIPIIIAGVITSVGASFLAAKLQGGLLKKLFAVFLLVLGAYQLFCVILQIIKNKKQPKPKKDVVVKVYTTKFFK